MGIFALFFKRAPAKVVIATLAGCVAGIGYSMLMPLLLSNLQVSESTASISFSMLLFLKDDIPLVFALVCFFIFLFRTCSQIALKAVAVEVASELRTAIYNKVSQAPIASLEQTGAARMVTALTFDVPSVVGGARVLPDLMISSITITGVLGYLFFLNHDVFWFLLICIVLASATYQIPIFLSRRHLNRAGLHADALQKAVDGLFKGAKELRLNQQKNRAYFDRVLLAAERDLIRSQKSSDLLLSVADCYGELVILGVIGVTVFFLADFRPVTKSEIVGITIAMLYIAGPVAALLAFVPQLLSAQVSMARVSGLLNDIQNEGAGTGKVDIAVWDTMTIENVTYRHLAHDHSSFHLGPISLRVRKGQITFIVGGNGSGKSTLSKIMTLHYFPSAGAVFFDDEKISTANITGYRQGISAIYSDYYLFDRALTSDDDEIIANVSHYLRALQLDSVVKFEEGRFSTLALSDGQRRRLALLVAILEDRQLYVFDEWAADQDPEFKRFFYHNVLPELRARGKCVIAITHDDRFFSIADQVFVMEQGTLVDSQLNR
jgi:putative pyoverdin transport system ATP-binding/permease protein